MLKEESKPMRAAYGEAQRYYSEVVLSYEGDECLTWPFARKKYGYGTIGHHIVHRLVCEHVNGPPPTPEHEAAHSCGKGHEGCVAKRHVSWKTHAENQADRIIHGTSNRGERHPMVKLTEADAREIRALKGVVLQRDIATKFGIGVATVSRTQSGKNWSWLTTEEAIQ